MKEIEKIILSVSARYLKDFKMPHYEGSKYYDDLSEDDIKKLSDYLIKKYPENWDHMDDNADKTMFNLECITKLLSEELYDIAVGKNKPIRIEQKKYETLYDMFSNQQAYIIRD
jgi:hypothetical protein